MDGGGRLQSHGGPSLINRRYTCARLRAEDWVSLQSMADIRKDVFCEETETARATSLMAGNAEEHFAGH